MFGFIKNILNTDPSKKDWLLAQEGEYAFWKGLSQTGYNDLSSDDFIATGQRDWLLGELEFTGKPLSSWKDSVVVEFGPGPAGFVEYIDAYEKHGVEPLIDKYRNDFPHLQKSDVIYHSDAAESVPGIPDNYADLVICFNMLDHTINPNQVMKELHRIAKPNADFLFQVNLYRHKSEIANRPPEHAALHPHIFLLEEIDEFLASNGFKVLKSHCRNEASSCGEYYYIATGVT